jgi:ParB-like chromosome segregation protein Spo0J
LRDSIAEFGVLIPVILDTDGDPVEGRHRVRIAEELHVGYSCTTVAVEDEARAKVNRRLNADRSRLTADQRRPVVAFLNQLGHSGRAIARALRATEHTIGRDLAWYREHHAPPTVSPPAPAPASAPVSKQAGRFVSGLAEVTSTCASLAAHEDLRAVLTPESARQWQPSINRALTHLRDLQNRMKEYAK